MSRVADRISKQQVPKEDGTRRTGPIHRVRREDLPGIQPTLFRELDHRIARTRLEHEPLPDTFLRCDDAEGGGSLVFRGRRYDLNITLFAPRPELLRAGSGSGVFVVSNGAGVATNTVDQLSTGLSIAGMVDLKRDFSEAKISAAFNMILSVRPDLDLLAVNMISGVATARDVVAALDRFCETVGDRVPVILRFTAPDAGDDPARLRALEQRRRSVTLVYSTRELVVKTLTYFHVKPVLPPEAGDVTGKVEAALEARARLGVTLDPTAWLIPDLAIENVFGRREKARVGVLGFGRTARYQIRAMLDQGVRISWATTPTAAKHADSGIPGVQVFPRVREAVAARGEADIVLNYAPAGQVLEATRDCIEDFHKTRLMILVAENVPYGKAIQVMDILEENGTVCVGPNSPGLLIVGEGGDGPDLFKLGNMPSFLFQKVGGMSVVGRSGSVIFDIVEKAGASGIGTRFAWAVGGDRYTGFGFLEALAMLEQDSRTRLIVLNGEAGGIQEQIAARLIATGIISKPVIALVTGESLPAGVQHGHQGSLKYAEADDPRVKKQHLEAAGVVVVDSPTELVVAAQEIERIGWDLEARRRNVLWERLVETGKVTGRRWPATLRPAYDLLYRLVGHYRLFDAQQRTPEHLHELTVHLTAIGVDRFSELLSSTIQPEAFVAAFEKSREYLAELARGIHEVGVANFEGLVNSIFSEASFNRALASTPWAAADIVNEVHAIGIPESRTVVNKTMGIRLFRETLASQPWNTAHAFRSINNMRWWRYVRAYDRCCTHLTGDNQLPKAAWRRTPWSSVKLTRLYDRMPDGRFERAIEDPQAWALFVDKNRNDPQGLFELAADAARQSDASGKPFERLFLERVRCGVPDRPRVEAEIERMGPEDFGALVDTVFTPEAFQLARNAHPNSTARALRIINSLGDAQGSGPRKIIAIYRNHLEVFDTPAFHLAVARNLWMLVELMLAMDRIDPIPVRRIVDYVVSSAIFNHALSEHQWGISNAFRKIAEMGPTRFLDTHRIIEDVTRDRESFSAAFKKNPRDAVEIVQVVALMGSVAFERLIRDPNTREAFLTRMRVCPRNAAHFLQQVAEMGVDDFEALVDADFGRDLLNGMLTFKGCSLVSALRRINIVGVEAFRHELREWAAEDNSQRLTVNSANDVVGAVKERVLERRFADPHRRIEVKLPGQPTYRVSEGEIRGLYESYPEWAEVLFKLQGDEEMTAAERVDLYRLVSGRKRFQTHMVSILSNFLPLSEIRARITAGEPLIREIRELRSVTQRAPHRFDAYFHTLEVMDQLENRVLRLEFLPARLRTRVRQKLEQRIDGVSRHDLLLLAAALHDIGKAYVGPDEVASHVERGLEVTQAILERLGLTPAQRKFVLAVIRHHSPPKLRKPGEPWDAFVARGGLQQLYDAITAGGANPYPVETVLHYHADILGQRGDETEPAQVARRAQVTHRLLEQYAREHPSREAPVDRPDTSDAVPGT
jgi:succinyl-CoA synthetase alpha subunit